MTRLRTALALMAAIACSGPTPPKGPRVVVLLVIDTLRADALGIYGAQPSPSPRIDALALDAVVFDSAYAASPWTRPSVASIFTGLHPEDIWPEEDRPVGHDSPLPDGPATLAERFAAAGWATCAVVDHPALRLDNGYLRGFQTVVEPWRQAEAGTDAPPAVWRRETAAAMRSADSRPLFLYLHLMQPHAPYGALRPRADLSEDNLTEVGNAYRSEVRLADKCVGAVLDAIGSRKDVLTIVTADHGEALGRLHHTFGHDHVFYDEVVRIPLLMSGPGLEPARVQDLARQVDLAPTIAALCGLGAAEVRRGTALSAVDPPKGAALIQFPLRGDRDAIAVTDGRTKWIVRGAAEPLLHFDLALDPTEQTPTGTLPEGAPKWQDLVGRLERGGIHHAPAGREAPNDERQARLDALGYAGD